MNYLFSLCVFGTPFQKKARINFLSVAESLGILSKSNLGSSSDFQKTGVRNTDLFRSVLNHGNLSHSQSLKVGQEGKKLNWHYAVKMDEDYRSKLSKSYEPSNCLGKQRQSGLMHRPFPKKAGTSSY